MSKFAIWNEVWNDGIEFEVLFMFDEEGSFQDVAPEGKAALKAHGVEDYDAWLGETEYPTKWEKYDLKSEYKEELI